MAGKLKERQFSWQPTLIEDWGMEEADEARPLETSESPDASNEPSGNVRKKKLSNQFAFDMDMSVTAPPAEEDEENIFVFTGPLDESEFEVGRSLTACSTPRPSPTDVDWPPAPARWSDSSSPQEPSGLSAPPNSSASSSEINTTDLLAGMSSLSSQDSSSMDYESNSGPLFGITDLTTPESEPTSDNVFDLSAAAQNQKSPTYSQ